MFSHCLYKSTSENTCKLLKALQCIWNKFKQFFFLQHINLLINLTRSYVSEKPKVFLPELVVGMFEGLAFISASLFYRCLCVQSCWLLFRTTADWFTAECLSYNLKHQHHKLRLIWHLFLTSCDSQDTSSSPHTCCSFLCLMISQRHTDFTFSFSQFVLISF